MTNRTKWTLLRIPFLVLLVIGTILIIRNNQEKAKYPYIKNEGYVFGTIYRITYQNDKDLESEIKQELAKVDESLSPFNPKSIISAINSNKDTTINTMFKEVFTMAQNISKETKGDYDITVSPLVNLWGFGFKHDSLNIEKSTIDSILQFVGYDKVHLEGDKIYKKDPRIMLDCSSIAKGYGVDVVARLLERKGVKNYLVEIGGEIVTKGISPKQVPWKIGINKPIEDSLNINTDLQQMLSLSNEAMATSGNYRNFYYKEGKKYAHTIDPHTGFPVEHNLLSATVIAKDCATADAYATSLMVMGIDKAKTFLEKHPELIVYLIYSNEKGENDVFFTPSLEKKFIK
ncbi:MAG: FAD:protein FMN transferase [Bacteroidales bacterium]|nr:FAD:protein FMN transferase [Candidatus Minthousia equi]